MGDDNNQIRVAEVPLRKWLQAEAKTNLNDKRIIIRKTTVAYAAAVLLQEAITIAPLSANKISLDNFIVRTKKQQDSSSLEADNIAGVDMISEKLSSTIIDPLNKGEPPSCDIEEEAGKKMVVVLSSLPGRNALAFEQIKERTICHLFGILLYQVYSNLDPFLEKNLEGLYGDNTAKEGLRLTYSTLRELGSPPNICMLVQNLAECKCDNFPCPHNTYTSLKEVGDDLQLLLLKPDRYLFTSNAFEGGRQQIRLQKGKLYGRDHEISLITDAFSTVCAGKSVALFVEGYSGSGKTRLVETVMERVNTSGGYVLAHKFDQLSRGGALLQLISAFDRLCVLIRTQTSPQDLHIIVNRLVETFGKDLSMLKRLLPEVQGFVAPSKSFGKQVPTQDDTRMNLQSVCFILQHFMRAVSSKPHPVMIFLDDLQWCNSMTLEVIQHVLCDEAPGANCCFFIGSYRSNEVASNHAVFRLVEALEASKITTQKLTLDGVKREDLHALISDALCIFPRLARDLSTIIHEKTNGNPFFFLEFLRSLEDRGLLRYTVRLERWEWDDDQIRLERITDNVLFLLSNKMNGMKMEVQMALKVLSSFGIKVSEKIVTYLCTTSQFSNILSGVEDAISEGFVSRVGEPACYAFVHDKVREAAYSLIPDDGKDEFHSKVGEAIRSVSNGDSLDDTTVITIADQINHNLSALKQTSTSMRLEVASLNHKAGLAAMSRSDYVTASSYLSVSLQLLPDGHWQRSYSLSLDTFLATAKVAYSSGDMDKSEAALKIIFKEATSLEDKLDAYDLYVNLLHSQEKGEEAHMTCQDVLAQLGEKIPEFVTPAESKEIIEETVLLVSNLSEEKLLKLKEADEKSQLVMRFIILMIVISYFSKPELLPYLNLRVTKLTMENGLCKYSLVGLIGVSFVLCNVNTLPKECAQLGFKIGALGMSMLQSHCDYSDMKSRVNHGYNNVLQHTDPVQKCAERARKGFEFGIASGDNVFAFLNANGEIRYSILAGANLQDLLRDTDKYLALVGHHGSTLSRTYMMIYRKTISTLIDNGEYTGGTTENKEKGTANKTAYPDRLSETLSFHKVLQSFWLGHHDRCHHHSEKLLETQESGKHHRLLTLFYHGLNSFVLLRKGKFTKKCAHVYKVAHRALKEAEELSRWNYRNKVYLLEAEKYSFQGYNKEARTTYAAAIMAARSSKFCHEQGLASECAAFHCMRVGETEQALKFFDQARICYNKWGSTAKVESVSHEMDQIRRGRSESPSKDLAVI